MVGEDRPALKINNLVKKRYSGAFAMNVFPAVTQHRTAA